MNKIITEITPLSDKDCFYLVDRRKPVFDYPLHRHSDMEINFVTNCRGCKRIAGDSIEELGYYDLCLIGPGLEHCWDQNGVIPQGDMREITIQFRIDDLKSGFLDKNQLLPIRELMNMARNGISFSKETIESLVPKFDALTKPQAGFIRLLRLFEILYIMATDPGKRQLSTSSFAKVNDSNDSRRVAKVEDYIAANYTGQLRLDDLAAIANMTPTAFSRFFRQRTGRTLSDYIIDIRIGHATRMLVDSNKTSSEICFECGFNNISNFNRLFRKKKGCSPMQFRENYLKTKIII